MFFSLRGGEFEIEMVVLGGRAFLADFEGDLGGRNRLGSMRRRSRRNRIGVRMAEEEGGHCVHFSNGSGGFGYSTGTAFIHILERDVLRGHDIHGIKETRAMVQDS